MFKDAYFNNNPYTYKNMNLNQLKFILELSINEKIKYDEIENIKKK